MVTPLLDSSRPRVGKIWLKKDRKSKLLSHVGYALWSCHYIKKEVVGSYSSCQPAADSTEVYFPALMAI